MCPNRAWRFLLIAFIPAALTAALLISFAGSRARPHRAIPHTVAAAPLANPASTLPKDTPQADPPQPLPQNPPSFTQLTSWYEGRQLRAWFAQHSGETCAFPGSDAYTCRFAKPRRLSIVIPEASDPALDPHLPTLAATLAAAPADVQVDIIHYRRADDIPLRYVQPTDVAELMLCAKLSHTPPNLYQACIDALSPRIESSSHKPAHFWQVTLANITSNTSGPPLQALLNTLQPQPQSAVLLLGHWDRHEILNASKNINPSVHLTIISDQFSPSTKLHATPPRHLSPEPLSTPASLAVLSSKTLDPQAVNAAVWRRYQPHPASACTSKAPPISRSWYQRYLRVLVLWYTVGLICLFALWSARRRFSPKPPSV